MLPGDIFMPDFSFDEASLSVWNHQLAHNPHIARYVSLLGTPGPHFIPIRFFRDLDMRTGSWTPETVFQSSTTSSLRPSRLPVRALSHYRETVLRNFAAHYGDRPRAIFALLPGYLERGNASLVRMTEFLIDEYGLPGSGFYLHNFGELSRALAEAAERNEDILLIGVTFALLDFAAQHPGILPPGSVIIETGGMKGTRAELTRTEVHSILSRAFGIPRIHSEYGMTELLSQAWSLHDGRFICPPWMRVTLTDPFLPSRILPAGATGRIAITDLANYDTCSFLLTDDLGRTRHDGTFEVLGRLDYADLRGCSLMYM